MTDDLLGNDTDDSVVDDAPDAGDRSDDESGDAASAEPDRAAATESDTTADPGSDSGTAATAPAAASAWGRWRERRRNRVSKWDRPPDPKDWRFFVGTLGKVLIATGILMFGFVAYQLWGTGIETARAQNALEDTFEAAVAANQAAADDQDGVDDEASDEAAADEPADEPLTTTPTDEIDAEPIDEVDEPDVEPADGVGGGTPSEVVPGGVDLSDTAVVQNVPVVPEGDPIAKLEIPRIGLAKYVVQGVTLEDLKKGPGHYPDTPLPGQLGNASIAGHRTTYGAPFFDVDQLQPGDEIIVTMVTGDRFVYSVTGSQVVTAADSWVIGTRDPNVAELTLTTCHPKYTARDRLVIHSVLVPERSAQVGQAEFWNAGTREVVVDAGDDTANDETANDEAGSADADRPAGDDPTFDTGGDDGTTGAKTQDDDNDDESDVENGDRTDAVFLDPTPDADQDDESGAAATGESATDDNATGDADETAGETTATEEESEADETAVAVVDPDDAEIDAFSEGWFDDDEAWPQIALWGSILTIISLLAYQLSKKTRHDSIGFMVGIFPFLIALYFFFQNVNRLLPPGL